MLMLMIKNVTKDTIEHENDDVEYASVYLMQYLYLYAMDRGLILSKRKIGSLITMMMAMALRKEMTVVMVGQLQLCTLLDSTNVMQQTQIGYMVSNAISFV
mmetsp:Transcript_12854/g.23107  ORF Transcript_12854/g.23107 Transcript_12854/m.23107 type:complete len:101 (-) Transcript_12854:285-587(-)